MHGVKHFPVGLEEGALSDLDVLILVGVAQVPGGLGGRQVRRVGLLEPVRVQLIMAAHCSNPQRPNCGNLTCGARGTSWAAWGRGGP